MIDMKLRSIALQQSREVHSPIDALDLAVRCKNKIFHNDRWCSVAPLSNAESSRLKAFITRKNDPVLDVKPDDKLRTYIPLIDGEYARK